MTNKATEFVFISLRYLVTSIHIIYGFLAVLLCHAMWGRRLFWYKNALFTVIKPDSWPMNEKKWRGGWFKGWGGVTFAPFSVMLAGSEGGMNTVTAAHELGHTRQMIVQCISALPPAIAVMIFCNVWLGLGIWALAPLWYGLGTYFEATTQNGNYYQDNISEEHARSVATNVVWQRLDDVLDGKIVS